MCVSFSGGRARRDVFNFRGNSSYATRNGGDERRAEKGPVFIAALSLCHSAFVVPDKGSRPKVQGRQKDDSIPAGPRKATQMNTNDERYSFPLGANVLGLSIACVIGGMRGMRFHPCLRTFIFRVRSITVAPKILALSTGDSLCGQQTGQQSL